MKMDNKLENIINPSQKKLICKPPIQQNSGSNHLSKINLDNRLAKTRPISPLLISDRSQE